TARPVLSGSRRILRFAAHEQICSLPREWRPAPSGTQNDNMDGSRCLKQALNRLLKKSDSCFDRLSTNGKSPTIASLPPFALSLSKGERGVFQQPVKRLPGQTHQTSTRPVPGTVAPFL